MEIKEIINGEVFFEDVNLLPTWEDDFPTKLDDSLIIDIQKC